MTTQSRRSFNAQMLGSLMTYGLIEILFKQDLFADSVKPVIQQWLVDLNALGRDVKDRKIKDTEWQAKVEELYRKVDLNELVQLLKLDDVAKNVRYPEKGAANLGIDLGKIEGLPPRLAFGKQIFALQRGRSVVPHGHDNMCTGFIILRGTFVGKHYDRVEDNADHYLIKPTIDRELQAGGVRHRFGRQGQCALVQGRFGHRVHLQYPHPRLQPGEQETNRADLRRSRRREDCWRSHRRQEDQLGRMSPEIRLNLGRAATGNDPK